MASTEKAYEAAATITGDSINVSRSRRLLGRDAESPGGDRPGLEVGELRLPKDTVVSLIIRDERPFYPDGRERIKVGELLVVTPEDQRENTEDRLRAVG